MENTAIPRTQARGRSVEAEEASDQSGEVLSKNRIRWRTHLEREEKIKQPQEFESQFMPT